MMNEILGWVWVHLGVVSGMLLGLGFLRPGFLGGYGSPRRRLLRLGHISFFGLGFLNILFGRGPEFLQADASALQAASIALVAAAISMPLACGLVAWRQPLFPVFFLPVAAALAGTGIIAWEALAS